MNSILQSNNALACRFQKLQYFSNLIFRKLAWTSTTKLKSFVPHIFAHGSKEKVTGINARRVVAMVANVKSFWNRFPIVKNPTYTVSTDLFPLMNWAGPDCSVSSLLPESRPNPAGFWVRGLLNVTPKSFQKRDGITLRLDQLLSSVVLHIKSVLMCHASGYTNIAGALSFYPQTLTKAT